MLAQTFAPDESAVGAAQVLDERCGAPQEELGVPPGDVIHLMRVLVPVTRNRFVRLAYQEREARDHNRLQPEIVALRNKRQLRKPRIAQ
jgi:hypothetical protein